jgi:hypothetical protein
MDGHPTALYLGGPLAGTTCSRAADEAWSDYRDEAGVAMDSVKGDEYLALVEKKATTGNAVARHLARAYKLLECPKATYYVEMRDYKLLKRAVGDPPVFSALTSGMRGDPRSPGGSRGLKPPP